MRLLHFCIGSTATQDLLISKTFIPAGASSEEESDIQKVWALFLDLFQNQHHWTPPSGPDSRSKTHSSRISSSSSVSTSVTGVTAGEHSYLQRPLYSQNCCFIYHTTNDIVLVACCPPPPTRSTTSSTVTRVPLSLPGQQQHIPRPTSSTSTAVSPAASGILAHSHSDSTASLASSSLHSDSHGSARALQTTTTTTSSSPSPSPSPIASQQSQYQKPELAFSTAAGLHVSLHGMVDFLAQLVKALERYLLSANGNSRRGSGSGSNSSGAGPRRVSQTISTGANASTATTASSLSSPASGLALSAELLQLNIGIVYEILDECMELGFPIMPSLAQLDLLVFGVSKAS